MKKVVMLSAVTLLSLTGIAVSQAQDTASTPAATASASAATASAPATSASASAASSAPAASAASTSKKEAPKAPEDPPQVKKLIALYPNLIARIAPQGKVCFEGQECDISITAALGAADANNPREGKVIYEGVCHTCHTAGLLGAPKFGDKAAWAPRIGKGTATLHDHALKGFNAMPAKGGNADLLDVEVTNAVDYMVSNAK